MATIIQRTFSDGPSKGIVLGYTSASINSDMLRTMTIGSNWNVIRMGLLCGLGPTTSQPFIRNGGIIMGFSSGSATGANREFPKTMVGVCIGTFILITNFSSNYEWTYVNDTVSGSYYDINRAWIGGWSAGSLDANSSVNLSVGTGVTVMLPNNLDAKQRRFPLILEISASSTTNMQVKSFGLPSNTLMNGDYTPAQLIACLSASVQITGITCSFTQAETASLNQRSITNITHDKTAYPLDTAFVDFTGTPPLEIYDWYIYKVR